MAPLLAVGVDVGGTNTDCAVLSVSAPLRVVASHKTLTTSDGAAVEEAVRTALESIGELPEHHHQDGAADAVSSHHHHGLPAVCYVAIGTTAFVNAVLERSPRLARVVVLRCCGTTSRAVRPGDALPRDLRNLVLHSSAFLSGGFEVDGSCIGGAVADDTWREEITAALTDVPDGTQVVVSGVFSPLDDSHERRVAALVHALFPTMDVSCSIDISGMGIVERENAAILNAALKPLARETLSGFEAAVARLALRRAVAPGNEASEKKEKKNEEEEDDDDDTQHYAPVYISRNDGTLLSLHAAQSLPIATFSSGPTNSMRGAAFLSGLDSAVVVDVGGTTADTGVLVRGFPRVVYDGACFGGVETNFQVPDVVSCAIGGGTYIRRTATTKAAAAPAAATKEGGDDQHQHSDDDDHRAVVIGPDSAGFRLLEQALCCGGTQLTATDIAVASSGSVHSVFGRHPPPQARALTPADVGGDAMLATVHTAMAAMLTTTVEQVRTDNSTMPLVLVGGGAALFHGLDAATVPGCSVVVHPPHAAVANAVGAALTQVAGDVDTTLCLSKRDRTVEMNKLKERAIQNAVIAGAAPATVVIHSVDETPFSYSEEELTRIRIRAVGTLDIIHQALEQNNKNNETEKEKMKNEEKSEEKSEEKKSKEKSEESSNHSNHGDDAVGDRDSNKTKKNDMTNNNSSHHGTVHGLAGGDEIHHTHKADPDTGVWMVDEDDLDNISVGAGILGTGGGGDPRMALLRAKSALSQGKTIRILSPDKVTAADVCVPVGFMGAPTVMLEKITNGREIGNAMRAAAAARATTDSKAEKAVELEQEEKQNVKKENNLGKRRVHMLSVEIGGFNAVEPLVNAAYASGEEDDCFVVDADLMGRAFPRIDMTLHLMQGCPLFPIGFADDKDDVLVFAQTSLAMMEPLLRAVTARVGSCAALALAPIDGASFAANSIPFSYSRAWAIGRAVRDAVAAKTDPVEALVTTTHGKCLIRGKVTDVTTAVDGGFNTGTITVHSLDNSTFVTVVVKNENLLVLDPTGAAIAVVPDLISLVDLENGTNVFTERCAFGMRVAVVVMPIPPQMRTENTLQRIGPAAFEFENVAYVPHNKEN